MNENDARKKSVLIVDDDTLLRDAIVFDFKRKGYQVFSASNGLEAFEIVKKEDIDAVVTDIRMPDGNGVELLDNIKAFDMKIPVVIFITGCADLTLEEAYDKGACMVMSKPFDRKILLDSVQRSLQSHSEKFAKQLATGSCDLQVELKSQDGTETSKARIVSIGHGGMLLIAEIPQAKPNQTVLFTIEHPNKTLSLLRGQGVVRWTRPTALNKLQRELGVEFIFLDEICRKDVIDFLEGLETKCFIPKAA